MLPPVQTPPPSGTTETSTLSREDKIADAVRKLRERNEYQPAFVLDTPVIDWQLQIDFEAAETAGKIKPLSELGRKHVTNALRLYAHNAIGAREENAGKGSRTTVGKLFGAAIRDLERLIDKLNKIAASQWLAPELARAVASQMPVEIGGKLYLNLRAALDAYTREGTILFSDSSAQEESAGHLTSLRNALELALSNSARSGAPLKNWPLTKLIIALGDEYESAGGTMAATYSDATNQAGATPFVRFVSAILQAGPNPAPTTKTIAEATESLLRSRPDYPGDFCDGPLKTTLYGWQFYSCAGASCRCKRIKWRYAHRQLRADMESDEYF